MVFSMSHLDQRGRRLAALSVIAGLLTGLAVALVPAAPAAAQSVNQSSSLQQLVDELAAQFWFAHRANLPEFQYRHEQLRQAIAAWNASSQNAADRQLMATWLRDAVHSSMPGMQQPLPPLPAFDRPAAQSAAESPTSVPAASVSVTSQKPVVPAVSDASRAEVVPDNGRAPDMPVESHAAEELPFWFAQPDEMAPTGDAAGNPFADDPSAE